MNGPRNESPILAADGLTIVGRSNRNRASIEDPSVSRLHCFLVRTGDRVRLYDARSRNGTWIDGRPARGVDLGEGSLVQIGRLHFEYRAGALHPTSAALPVPPARSPRPRRRGRRPPIVLLSLLAHAFLLPLLAWTCFEPEGAARSVLFEVGLLGPETDDAAAGPATAAAPTPIGPDALSPAADESAPSTAPEHPLGPSSGPGMAGTGAGRPLAAAAVPSHFGPPRPPFGSGTSLPDGPLGRIREPEVWAAEDDLPVPGPPPRFVTEAVTWLADAQNADGGWGATGGSSSGSSEPATTAFVGLSFLRIDPALEDPVRRRALERATAYLLREIASAPASGPALARGSTSQPQRKLGPGVDTALTALYLSRLLLADPEANPDIGRALDACLARIVRSQGREGAWGDGGWAPVLQSAIATAALEMSRAAGREVDEKTLVRARRFHIENMGRNSRGRFRGSAGVELYARAAALRAAAIEARAARNLIEAARRDARLPARAAVTPTNLERIGVERGRAHQLAEAFEARETLRKGLDDRRILDGFGSVGGEEYLSFALASEAVVLCGADDWEDWQRTLVGRLKRAQDASGSWSGHHCISSTVFTTAAAVQCLTAAGDALVLNRVSHVDRAEATKTADLTVRR